jgi:predicted transcriptional regulator
MPTRFTVVCDDDLARDVRQLAWQHGLTEQEVLRQLLAVGVESLDEGSSSADAGRETMP